MAQSILIVDDEKEIVSMLYCYFSKLGYTVYTATAGNAALKEVEKKPDIILLDVNMPDIDGFTVCERIRDYVSCPIIFLTARIEDSDKIKGFSIGADDYVIKPFSVDELEARIAAHLRREKRHNTSSKVQFDEDMVIDYSSRIVFYHNKDMAFTKKEFDIISFLLQNKAITRKQERAFLEFVANDKHFCRYYEGIFILFKTGLRISEFVGLTLSDLDMQNRKISVNHQLQRKRNMEYVIEDTKTSCGTREIPMTDEVYKCFQRIISSRKKPRVEPIVGGKCGFLYLDKNDMPMVALHWEKYFQHICEKYNSIYRVQMPKVTPHVCRHTFCSNMAKSGMNPKTLQYLMGHSDISVTLNTYTHIGYDDAKEELKRVVNGE